VQEITTTKKTIFKQKNILLTVFAPELYVGHKFQFDLTNCIKNIHYISINHFILNQLNYLDVKDGC